MLRRCQGIVQGRVQGVGFRFYTRKVARKLGLGGWVINLLDGMVGFEVEGSSEKVEQFLESMRQGPPMADVDRVVISPDLASQAPAYQGFEIRF